MIIIIITIIRRPTRRVRRFAPVPQSLRFCFVCILVSKILSILVSKILWAAPGPKNRSPLDPADVGCEPATGDRRHPQPDRK